MFKSFLVPKYHFEEHETLFSFRFKMLKFLVLAVSFFAFLFASLDLFGVHPQGLFLRYADFTVGLITLVLFIFLQLYKKAYIVGLYLLVFISFSIFTLAFFFAMEDTARQMWFVALIMATFMMHSIRLGIFISLLSMTVIVVSYYVTDVNMNELTIVTTIISMLIMTSILFVYTRRVNEYEEELMEKNRILDRLASHDTLTGVMNRRIFLSMSNKYFLKAKRTREHFYFLMMDIDHFKSINDTYGHQAGDYVLIHTADLIASALRENDLFGRLGGEEFGVAVIEPTIDDAYQVAEKIRQLVDQKEFIYNGNRIGITLSVGIASADERTTLTDTMNIADKAMYRAKESGRNSIKTEKEFDTCSI